MHVPQQAIFRLRTLSKKLLGKPRKNRIEYKKTQRGKKKTPHGTPIEIKPKLREITGMVRHVAWKGTITHNRCLFLQGFVHSSHLVQSCPGEDSDGRWFGNLIGQLEE